MKRSLPPGQIPPRRKSTFATRLLLLCGLLASLVAQPLAAETKESETTDPLKQGFEQPPESAKPWIYWMWMNGFITTEGITADLEAMHRVGIGGVQIFFVQQTLRGPDGRNMSGTVHYMTPEWRAAVKHAVAECHRLGMTCTILNCEGWGQAGGPEVPPSQSMLKVVWSATQVTGGGTVPLTLPQPETKLGYYQDIGLFALPSSPGDEPVTPAKITCSTGAADIKFGAPGYAGLTMTNPMPGAPQWVQLDFDRPHSFSSLHIAIDHMRDVPDPESWTGSGYLDHAASEKLKSLPDPKYWELQTSDDGGKTFHPVTRVNSHGTSTFPGVTAKTFRIWMPVPAPLARSLPFKGTEPINITDISFAGSRLDNIEARVGKTVDSQARLFSSPGEASQAFENQAVNLTGRTEWKAPPGNWTLLRMGFTTTGNDIGPGEANGLEIDKMSRDASIHHFNEGMLKNVLADSAQYVGNTLKNVHADSWEKGYENWTPLMREEFLKRRGYAMDPWLPAIAGYVVGNTEVSERFLWDYRRTIADMVADNYYQTMSDVMAGHHMGITAEAAGHGLPGVVDQLMCKGRVGTPMGEFWLNRGDVDDVKEASSASHIYGKEITGAEALTAIPAISAWRHDLYSLTGDVNLRLCYGVTRLSFHVAALQPWTDRAPGMTMGSFGTDFDRTNTWWEFSKDWFTNWARCQFMLRQGTFVADLCYYYGEDAPVGFLFHDLNPPSPPGYDLDACNAEILKRFTVKDGRLTLPTGMSYRVLVLPDSDRMTPDVLKTIGALIHDGATVAGPKPKLSPSLAGYPQSDRDLQALATEIWGDCDGKTVTSHAYGKGRVIRGAPLTEAIDAPPDFTSPDPDLKFIHRRDGGTEIYFVSNQSAKDKVSECTFRVNGLAPEIWQPETGRIEIAAMYESKGGLMTVPVHFKPEGGVFVVFRKPANPDPLASMKVPPGAETTAPPIVVNGAAELKAATPGTYVLTTAKGATFPYKVSLPSPLELTGPWQLTFPPKLGAPPSATFEKLDSWTHSAIAGIKYFSGTATYQKDFTLPKGWRADNRRCFLDLGDVRNLAQVKINGKELRVMWRPPFRLDVTPELKEGENHLEIQVTNLWPNRLTGDAGLPVADRIAYAVNSPYKTDSPLFDSGLLGPVTIEPAQVIRMNQ